MDANAAILIAEDEAINRMFIAKIIRRLGYTVYEAKTGLEAVHLCEDLGTGLDLIFMDLSMPVMDGIEATRKIRERDSGIVIIALTAHSTNEDKKLCSDAGMNGMLIKPVQVQQLRESIETYIDKSRKRPSKT